MLTITLSVLAVTIVVAGFLLVAKRHPRTAQATYNEHAVPTDSQIAKALAERQALDAAVRRELEHSTVEELLDEMATFERPDFPADGHAVVGPRTCITHVRGEVHFAAPDDGGRLAKMVNWFFDRLRGMCL